MVQLECAGIVLEGVGEQRERELCRSGIAFVPRKTVWRMFMQIETGIERTLVFALAYGHPTRLFAGIENLSHERPTSLKARFFASLYRYPNPQLGLYLAIRPAATHELRTNIHIDAKRPI